MSFWASSKLILTFTKWGRLACETTSVHGPQFNFRLRSTTSVYGQQLPSSLRHHNTSFIDFSMNELKMDWELAYPELLPLLKQWRRFFRVGKVSMRDYFRSRSTIQLPSTVNNFRLRSTTSVITTSPQHLIHWFQHEWAKNGLGISISWIITSSKAVASFFSKFGSTGRTIFMTAEAISTNEVFKNPLAENPALVDII